MAAAPQDVLFIADPGSFAALTEALQARGLSHRAVAPVQRASIELALNLQLRRLVVVDLHDEERARERVIARLVEDDFPDAIVETIEVSAFVSDFLVAIMAGLPMEAIPTRRFDAAPDPRLYAIVGAPKSGSKLLCSLLIKRRLGRPTELIRPWMAALLRQRPPQLFNGIRLLRNRMRTGAVDGVFGVHLGSDLVFDTVEVLNHAEREYLAELVLRTAVFYLPGPSAAVSGAPIAEEPALARRLAALDSVHLIENETFRADPLGVCDRIAAETGVVTAGQTSADDAKPPPATEPSVLTLARTAARAQRDALEARAARIRAGHAKKPHGEYQDRHYYLVDYDHQSYPGLDFMFRGPAPRDIEGGDFVIFLGGSQCMGAFVDRPFAAQVAEAVGIDALNLGRSGAGPYHFIRQPLVRKWIGGARAVVVQAMSARMSDTEIFRSEQGRSGGWLLAGGEARRGDCEEAWSELFATGAPAQIDRVLAQARRHWIAAMHATAELASGPSVLVWMSAQAPVDDDDQAVSAWGGGRGEFPDFIDRRTFDAAAKAFDAVVEVVAHQAEPEPIVSVFSGERLPVVFGGAAPENQSVASHNAYYPGQGAHDAVAAALSPVLKRLLAVDGGAESRIE